MDSSQVNLQSKVCWPLVLPLFPIEPAKWKWKINPSAAQKLSLYTQNPPSRCSRDHKRNPLWQTAALWCSALVPDTPVSANWETWALPTGASSLCLPCEHFSCLLSLWGPTQGEAEPVAGKHQWNWCYDNYSQGKPPGVEWAARVVEGEIGSWSRGKLMGHLGTFCV